MTSSPPQKIPETNPTASEKVSAACLVESEVNFPTNNSRVSDLMENSLWQPSGTSTPFSDTKDDASSPVTACHVGHRVCVGGTKVGILRYFGDIEFTTGLFCGVELDEPVGLNDGSVQGVRYFTCRPNYGIIAPVRIVKPLPGGSWKSRRKHSPDGTCRTRRRSATFSMDVSGPFNPLDGLVSPDDSLMVHMEDNDATTSTRDVPLSNAQSQQQSSGSTPTPSSATSNQVLWECWNQQQPCSSSLTSSRQQHQQKSFEQDENLGITSPDRLESSPYRSSLTSYRQQHQENSFEQDESLGILTPDQPESPQFSSSSTPSQLQHHQNSFEQDESLGILTPDQLESTQFVASSVPWQINQQFLSSSLPWQLSQTQPLQLSKQSSFEQDESLGILTPDQMTDFTVCAESSSVGRISSFEDKGTFLLGDFRSELVDDLLPDRMPSESDGPSSSTYPSSEFPQFPADTPDLVFNPQGETINPNDFSVTMVEGVTMRELELHNHDALSNQQHCASNKVLDLTMCEDLSDNVCPAITSKSSTPASMRVGQDISDRTLSPEDLPMDAPFQGVIGEILQKSEVTTSESGRDNSGISGVTSAGPSSRSSAAPPPPNSFVTSVTSITSLDNGYQGDGEWSRPASRGADHSPTSHRVIKQKTADPMTDSDFFTESDADMHDEMTAASGRGDRRAQVIDGTLYGTNLHSVLLGQQHQRCPSFTASINEEMESSGVYSDLERRPEDPGSDGKEFQSEERAPVGGDFSPDGSIKTVSSRSEQSQVKETPPGFTTIISKTTPDIVGNIATAMDTTEAVNDLLIENNVKNSQMAGAGEADSVDRSLLKVERMPSSGNIKSANSPAGSILNTSTGSKSSKEESQQQLKKYKMPKRNVVSKIKAMIESSAPSTGATRSGAGSASTEDENQENRRPTRSPSKSLRKNAGRWDAVMNKIAQGQAEQKLKPRSLKEVKSKVFANILPAPPPQTDGLASRNRKTSTSDKTSSSRALKENSPLKAKSRRARTRTSTTSLAQQQQTSGNPTIAGRVSSPNSSPHSSISDVSVNQNHSLGKASTKSVSSLRSSKKREVGRSTSPLSDGSTNSTASHVMTRSSSNHLPPLSHHTHISSARERVLRDNVNRNSPANLQKQRQPRNPRVLLSNMVNKHSNGRRTSAPIQEKNGVSVTAAVDMKTPPVRKQASRRNTPSNVQKPTPLRDHNRQQQAGGGGVFKTGEALPSNKPGELAVPPQQPPPATQPQPTPAELLLPQLRHNSAGFEALGVLVQYLVFNLDAFSTPQLQKDLQRMKTEWLKTKLELEEAQVSYRRIEDNLVQEKALHSQKIEELETARHCQLSARDAQHSREIAELVARHEAQLTDFEKRLQEQLEEMKGRYEMELSRAEEQHAHKLESVIVDGKASLEQLKHDHEAAVAHLQVDAAQREAELRRKLTSIEEEYSGLKDQSRKLMDSMQKDKDTKLQATAGRCKELQDEVESLRTVLDLRHEELQELRKQNALLTREAEELPLALQRVAALDAKVEDLQVQLEMKTSLERQLSQDNRLLMESFQQESKQNKRLSLHNEELQWKLKQNVEVVLTALSAAGSLHTPATNGRRSTHGSAQSLTDAESSTVGGNQLFATRTSPRPLSAGRSHNSNGSELSANPCVISRPNPSEDLEASPPASPKVKGVVEKSDSVSWVLEMDETPEALLSRLVRRAGSFRGTTPPPSSVPSPAHARTLPPPKRQRCKASSLSLSSSATTIARCNLGSQSRNTPLTSSLRSRSRSVSTDSVEGMGLDYSTWSPTSSTPLQKTCRDIRENDMVMLMNGSKNSLKRCGDDVYVSDDHEDSLQNASSAIHTLSGIGNSTMNRTSECSNDDSPSKSPGSSGSSDGSMHGGQKEHDHPCHRNRKQVSGSLTDPSATSDSLDLGDTEVLPLPPLPGSTSGDLSLLAAQPFPPMPKESAGEAMISEETSEDENDNEDEINSSSDEHSCSEDEETSSSSGSSSDMEPVGARGLVAHDEDIENDSRNRKQEEEEVGGRTIQKQDIASGQQNLASSTGSMQQYHLLLMSDSGSYSTTATTMDLSWSEDMELMPSESEG